MENKKPLNELLEFSILNIDKPSGPTSFDISDLVRKKLGELGIKKTSHFGTLDPHVSGVLPIALNRACKLTGFFLGEDKEYVGIMRLHEEIPLEKIKEAIRKKFLGKIKQTPPVKSRVKRQEREREVKRFEILEVDETPQGCIPGRDENLFEAPKIKDFTRGKDFLFIAEVQGGTYIRKLIDDLGKELGIGAHMLELRRIRAGIFNESDGEFVNLYDLEKAIEDEDKLRKILIPAEEALKKIFPVVEVKDDCVKQLLTGKPVRDEDLENKINVKRDDLICVFAKDKFIGIYRVALEENKWARPEFVMQPIKN